MGDGRRRFSAYDGGPRRYWVDLGTILYSEAARGGGLVVGSEQTTRKPAADARETATAYANVQLQSCVHITA